MLPWRPAIATFNHDLLLNEGDAERARRLYPLIGEFLDWSELREAFRPIDAQGNTRRQRARTSGFLAVMLGTAALCVAALEPRLHELHLGRDVDLALTLAALLLGVFALLIAGGVLRGAGKREWLHHRAATERLRQLHFQWLVRRAKAIAVANTPAARRKLHAERARLLGRLAERLPIGKTALVAGLVDDVAGESAWLAPSAETPAGFRPEAFVELVDAYRNLRLSHQADYAAKMLERGVGFWPREPRGQGQRIASLAFLLTLGVIVVHFISAVTLLGIQERPAGLGAWLQTSAILLAVLALGLRALEGGLRTGVNVVRYVRYKNDVEVISLRFDHAGADVEARIAEMEKMEELSYRELREFLADSDEADFLI